MVRGAKGVFLGDCLTGGGEFVKIGFVVIDLLCFWL